MRRLSLFIFGLLVVFFLLVAAGGYWLMETPDGARFALTHLTAMAGIRLSVREVQGRLLDRLHLKGVQAVKGKQRAEIDDLDLSWEPRQLFNWKVMMHELTLSGVRIQDDTPPTGKPPQFVWPRITGTLRQFGAEITRLRITDLSYRHLASPPVVVRNFSSPVVFSYGILSLSDLGVVLPQGRAHGEVVIGMWRPTLKIDLAAVPTRPVQGMDHFSLHARLLPGQDPEQLAGNVAAAGKSGDARRLEVTGELGITTNSFNFRRLAVTRPGRSGTAIGDGSVTLTKGEPIFSVALRVKDLDLSAELKRKTRLTGTATFSGTPSAYRGNFALSNAGPGWERAALAANYRGGRSAVTLTQLAGKVLEGRVTGALDLAWSRGMQVSGNLSGRGLNPARLAPRWAGVVNLDLVGKVEIPKGGEARGAVRSRLLQSRLHGQELSGNLDGAFAGKSLRIDRLLLVGSGFNLRGAGELDRRLNLVAHVSDLSRLAPGTAGRIDAEGWVRWRDGLLSGSARGRGAGVAVAGVRAAALQLDASLGEGKEYPVKVDATARGVSAGKLQVETAQLALRGTASRHDLRADLYSPGTEAHAALSGGYRNGTWRGELSRLYGRDNVGPFALAAPVPLMLSSSGARVAPLVINGLPGERVELAGEFKRHPSSGSFRGGWSGLNLARANQWLEGTEVSGGSSGSFDLRLLPGNIVTGTLSADARGTVVTDRAEVKMERLTARINGDGRGLRAAVDLLLEGGAGEGHLLFTSARPASLAVPREGDLSVQLANFDLELLRPAMPANMIVDGRLGGLVKGRLLPGRKLDLRGNLALDKGHLTWRGEPDELFDATIDSAELFVNWQGPASAGKAAQGVLQLTARADATGTYTARGQRIALSRFTLRVDADRYGSRANFEGALDQGGALRAAFTSSSPATVGIPETGEFALEWGGINPAMLKPFLPAGLNVEGNFAGQGRGRLLPGRRLEMSGESVFSQGRAEWQGQGGEVRANLRSASLAFVWRGETLSATLDLALAEYGQARGSLALPVPARLPVTPDPNGALQGAVTGKVQEHGFLASFLPGLVQESHGQLDLDLRVGGVWSNPRLDGTVQLSRGGAYLPTAGITLSEVQFLARLQGDEIRVEGLRAVSGAGHVDGNMVLRLKDGRLAGYSGTLTGDRFQTVFLPELEMVTSPRLTFQGVAKSVTVRGEVRVPQMLVSGPPLRPIVTPSGDVILEGAPPSSTQKKFPLVVDGMVHVVLGDRVQVKASGIDAKLGGDMDLVLKGLDNITSSGEIRVVKGSYKAYGVDLEIERGRLYYTNDPVTQPTLDILALRTVGDVKAGVTIGGYLRSPVVKLYSEPSMPEVDILAYMLLGHPLGTGTGTGTGTEQATTLALAASGMLSFGQSESLQEQIKDRLGLSVLGVETVTPSTAGLMGYKEISVTPTGAPAKAAATESVLTVGKYLTPKLYLSYGRSLVTGGSLFMLRYDLFKHWQIETQSGTESGADLYYKLEFD